MGKYDEVLISPTSGFSFFKLLGFLLSTGHCSFPLTFGAVSPLLLSRLQFHPFGYWPNPSTQLPTKKAAAVVGLVGWLYFPLLKVYTNFGCFSKGNLNYHYEALKGRQTSSGPHSQVRGLLVLHRLGRKQVLAASGILLISKS